MRTILWNVALAIAVTALTLASCQRPFYEDPKTVFGRQAIDLMAEGERYEEAGNYALALDRYGKALELSPRPALYYRIGRCYFQRSEYTRAYEYLTWATRLAGDYAEAEYLLHKVRIQMAVAARQTGKATPTPARTVAVATPAPRIVAATPSPRPAVTTPTVVAVATPPRPTPPRETVVEPITPVRTPKPTATPTPLPREPTPTERPPVLPERTPVVVTPTPKPIRTPEPIAPTPTPKPTPTPSAIATTAPFTPVVVTTPPPSVEPIATPRPRPRSPTATTRTVQTVPPLLRPEEIFPTPQTTDVTTPSARTTTMETTSPAVTSPLLSQWQFHLQQAQSFLDRKEDQAALDELNLVLGAQPRHLEALLLSADTYDRLGRGERALEQYEKARVFHPAQPKPYFRTGNYYLRHAEDSPKNAAFYDRARIYYFEAIHHDPKYHFAHHNVGVSYMKQSNYETARQWFEKALEIKPDYASAHYNLGILYEQHLKNTKAALHHYRQYLKLGGPDSENVREWVRALEEAE